MYLDMCRPAFLANIYRDFSCTPTISTSLSEEAMLIWPLRWEPSLRDSSTCMCPETKKERKKNKIWGGEGTRSHIWWRGPEAAGLRLLWNQAETTTVILNKSINKMVSWIDSDRLTVTLDKTQTVNLSRCERSITTVLRQNRLYSTKSETGRGRRSRQRKGDGKWHLFAPPRL